MEFQWVFIDLFVRFWIISVLEVSETELNDMSDTCTISAYQVKIFQYMKYPLHWYILVVENWLDLHKNLQCSAENSKNIISRC